MQCLEGRGSPQGLNIILRYRELAALLIPRRKRLTLDNAVLILILNLNLNLN
jgi:hypothetical protein